MNLPKKLEFVLASLKLPKRLFDQCTTRLRFGHLFRILLLFSSSAINMVKRAFFQQIVDQRELNQRTLTKGNLNPVRLVDD